jgi:prevent-host-death family protein
LETERPVSNLTRKQNRLVVMLVYLNMTNSSATSSKSVGAYEAKSKLSELLDLVERGQTITITRHARDVAKLVPAGEAVVNRDVFARIRALRERLAVGKGESAKDLINAGRRI